MERKRTIKTNAEQFNSVFYFNEKKFSLKSYRVYVIIVIYIC